MRNSLEDLRQTMRAKTDEELYLLLRVHSQDYAPVAIKAASEEFSQRQLDEPTMHRIMAVAEKALDETGGAQGGPERRPMGDTEETTAGWGWSDYGSDLIKAGKGWGCLILLCIVGYAIYGGYEWLDSIGWISHREETVISARSDWLPGESKECLSYTRKREWATFQDKDVGYAMPWVKCDDGPDHHMKVTFYGRKVQPEYQTIGWRCSRNEVSFLNDNSFTCYQTGGER